MARTNQVKRILWIILKLIFLFFFKISPKQSSWSLSYLVGFWFCQLWINVVVNHIFWDWSWRHLRIDLGIDPKDWSWGLILRTPCFSLFWCQGCQRNWSQCVHLSMVGPRHKNCFWKHSIRLWEQSCLLYLPGNRGDHECEGGQGWGRVVGAWGEEDDEEEDER